MIPARKRSQAGVTLIEMLVVVTIIALFAALVGPKLFQNVDKAKVASAKAQINSLMTALGNYKLEVGVFPTNEQGLQSLWVKPNGVNNWSGPYLQQEVPKDPWRHDYIYKYPGEHGDQPDLTSLGADGQLGGEGINADVVSWRIR